MSTIAIAALPALAVAADMDAFEKAELAQLSPKLRADVEARMTGGQTTRGILETLLLNNISSLFAARKVTAVDVEKGIAVVETQDGTLKAVPFDVTTLDVKA